MIKFILMDVEGTTTDIKFVKDVLFPYAYTKIPLFIEKHFSQLEGEAKNIGAQNPKEMSETLRGYISQDKKDPVLKQIQGKIWKEGYAAGELKGHVYKEVKNSLINWKKAGLELGIYSSGSIEAQKLLYSHSVEGDLTVYLSRHFDLGSGNKKEAESYRNILNELPYEGDEVLFLSDVEEELDAAKKAGMATARIFREGIEDSKHPAFESFDEISLDQF